MAEPTKLGITITSLSPDLNKDVEAIVTRALEEIRRVVGLDILIQSEVAAAPIQVFGGIEDAEQVLEDAQESMDSPYIDHDSAYVKSCKNVKVDGWVEQPVLDALSYVIRRGER